MTQADLALIRSRDVFVRARIRLINHVRGAVKSVTALTAVLLGLCGLRDDRAEESVAGPAAVVVSRPGVGWPRAAAAGMCAVALGIVAFGGYSSIGPTVATGAGSSAAAPVPTAGCRISRRPPEQCR